MRSRYFGAAVWGVMFVILWAQAACAQKGLKQISEKEDGMLYSAGKFNVVVLKGSYREMGRQYGALMKDNLARFYNAAITEQYIRENHLPYEIIRDFSKSIYEFYPRRFKEIVNGMAETSGLDMEKLAILNQITTLKTLTSPEAHCSGIGAWGDYTGGGPLVFGRNFDYPPYFKKFAEFLTLAVFNPDDGSNPAAIFGYAGQIDVLNGMNKEGLFLEVNDGTISGGRIFADRISILILTFAFLLDNSTMAQLDQALNTTRTGVALVLNVADKNGARSYEWAIFDMKRRTEDRKGLIVGTNHFIDPSWNLAAPFTDEFQTMLRRKNLLALGEKHKGKLDPATMMEILDTPIEAGGATFIGGTIYQVVAVPRDLAMWFKAPGYADWTRVALGPLFK